MRSGRERTLAEGGRKNRKGGERWERAEGEKKETLHNKNALNYRMKPSSNCVIRLFLSPSSLAFERLFRVIVRVKKMGPNVNLVPMSVCAVSCEVR